MHDTYRMIVCDLDNTLVDHKKQISKETIDYMIKLQEKGYFVVLASGRYISEIEPVASALQIKEHHGIVIACNGFEVYDYRDDTYHQFTPITNEEANQLVEIARKHKCSTYLYEDNTYYFVQTKGMKRLMKPLKHLFPLIQRIHPKLHHGIDRYNKMTIIDKEPHFEHNFQKLCFIGYKPKHIVNLETDILHRFPHQYQFFYENPMVTEIAKHDVSKLHAVEYITKKHGYDMQEVIAFGDNGNDLLLLEAAGHGVTMKNAGHYIKKQARYLTKFTCDENGVMEYLKELGL